jgi:integrase
MAALKAHRIRQNEERLRLGDLWEDDGLVFPNRVGKPLDHNNLYYRDYKNLLEKSGLAGEGFTFHSLRRTFATELFNQRKRPKVIQSLLDNADDAHLLAPLGRRGRLRGRRFGRGVLVALFQAGCRQTVVKTMVDDYGRDLDFSVFSLPEGN